MKKPWRNKERLEKLYVEKRLSAYEIADRLGCGTTAIYDSLEDFNIEKREQATTLQITQNRQPACYRTNARDGYEEWFNQHNGKSHYCRVHRLAAVAWFGFDDVKDKIIHHSNGIPWLNIEDNLEVVESQAEHARMHHEKRKRNAKGEYE
jgi:predicted DNA-binding protein YlxM (UPF0122 family)